MAITIFEVLFEIATSRRMLVSPFSVLRRKKLQRRDQIQNAENKSLRKQPERRFRVWL
jgi:hypothetical protein